MSERIQFVCSDTLAGQLRARCADSGMTLSEVIRASLAHFLRCAPQSNGRGLLDACQAALYLMGTDADRAEIGKRPWLPFSAEHVPQMLRDALGMGDAT